MNSNGFYLDLAVALLLIAAIVALGAAFIGNPTLTVLLIIATILVAAGSVKLATTIDRRQRARKRRASPPTITTPTSSSSHPYHVHWYPVGPDEQERWRP